MSENATKKNAAQPTACILCSRNCGIAVNVDGRHLAKIKGDPAHPMTHGYICQKAARLEHYQNNDDRLDSPLKRRKDGSFERITWDQAISEIARRLESVREQYGPDAFATVGGGGQGNHLGGAYGAQLRQAMGGSRYVYSALAQEKTMDFWVNGRLFGDQRIHCTEDVEHSDYVLFIGCNPYQSHGIPNARDTLKQLKKDPQRKMVVFDPRRTETAKAADIHIQLKSGTDVYVMLAMLATIVTESLHDTEFLKIHTSGFEDLERILRKVPIAEYAAKADVPLELVQQVAREFASAQAGCVRVDLGIQQSLHSTVTTYLEKMLYLVTGNFGKRGGNNLHTSFLPILGNSDERKRELKLTARHKMQPISGMYPPNILPDEIEYEGEGALKAVWVESCNPVMSYADTTAYERAFRKLDILVVVDVAMTETARLADYVLPASSQFEKWEATGFNAEFPENFFHLRKPIVEPLEGTLPEPEIYTRLLEEMGMIPKSFPVLSRIAKYEPEVMAHQGYLAALMTYLKRNKSLLPFAPSILYRSLGPSLADGAAIAALLLPLAIDYANKHFKAVKRAGIPGNKLTLGPNLFKKILDSHSGVIISKHEMEDLWGFIKNKDGRIHLAIEEVFSEINALDQCPDLMKDYPFILMAGERRSYNANQIYRNPAWRKTDKEGALRIHPEDAEALELNNGDQLICRSEAGELVVVAEFDDGVRRGLVTLPHGYGMRYKGGAANGPALNILTAGAHCDPFTKTPYHKYVPVKLEKIAS